MRPRLLIQACLLGLAVLAGSCQDPASPSPKSKDEPSPGASATNDEDDAQKDALLDCDALVATGNDPGEVPVDLVRLASTGKEISLRSYCNQPLLVLSGTAYCSSWEPYSTSLAEYKTLRPGDNWDWSSAEATRAAAALKHFKDSNLRVFFLLHTNHDGKPATSVKEAKRWDTEFQWSPGGITLIDGDRKGNAKWFDGAKKGSMILTPGFKIYAVNSDDYIRDIQAALNQAQGKKKEERVSNAAEEAPADAGPESCNPGTDWPEDELPKDEEPEEDPKDDGG